MKNLSRLRASAALLTLVSISDLALAQDNVATADRLFGEAKALSKAGRYAEACPKLAQSLELDPAIGTEFNLADCLEHIGKKAQAWRHYENVERVAHSAGKTDRKQAASKRREALRASLGWIALSVREDITLLELSIDDEPLDPRVALGKPLAADPGTHRIAMRTARQATSSNTLTVMAGETITLAPTFAVSEPPPRAAEPPAAAATTSLASRPPLEPAAKRGGPQRSVAVVVGAVGVAGLALGGASGIFSLASHGTAVDRCPDPTACSTDEGVDSWRRATTAGTISTIGLAAGGALVVAAVVLWVTAPTQTSRTARTTWDLGGVHF